MYTRVEDANRAIVAEQVELSFDPPHEVHGLLQRPRQLVPVLHQHVVIRFLIKVSCHYYSEFSWLALLSTPKITMTTCYNWKTREKYNNKSDHELIQLWVLRPVC